MADHVPAEPMSVGLQGRVGGANDGCHGNASGVSQSDVAVDYVRVYEYAPLG